MKCPLIPVILFLITTSAIHDVMGAGGGRFICYFPNWATYRSGNWTYSTDNIDPNLCTHLIYSFTSLDGNTFKMISSDPNVDIEKHGYQNFVSLKENQNPNLKMMIAVGGWADSTLGDNKYTKLVSSDANIAVFVDSVVSFLTQYGFDGLDLDWEYPSTSVEDTVGFINLLQALSDAFKPSGFILSAAVSAYNIALHNNEPLGYNIPEMDRLLDFVNLMTYDMHSSWELTSADHHAPLYKRSWETADINVDDSVNFWIREGLSPAKINLGIPLYGRTWKLDSSGITVPPAPASGTGDPGQFTQEAGFMSYFEICENIRIKGWNAFNDTDQQTGPYAYSPTSPVNWVGYDDVAMVITKSKYLLSKGLGGAMVWEVSLDDFNNACLGGFNPLLTAISQIVVT